MIQTHTLNSESTKHNKPKRGRLPTLQPDCKARRRNHIPFGDKSVLPITPLTSGSSAVRSRMSQRLFELGAPTVLTTRHAPERMPPDCVVGHAVAYRDKADTIRCSQRANCRNRLRQVNHQFQKVSPRSTSAGCPGITQWRLPVGSGVPAKSVRTGAILEHLMPKRWAQDDRTE